MLSAGLAVEPAHRVGHGLGLGPPHPHHPMLQAFGGGEFLRPLPVHHRPGEPGPGAAMFSPPDVRYWLHHHQQQHHLARFGGQGVSHHRLPATPTPTPQAPPPAPSPAPVNLSASHKDEKDHLPAPAMPMGFHYPHYPMPTPMFSAPYSPYAARLPPPSDAPAAYSPPAGTPAPLPPPPPKPAAKTFKVPSGKEGSLKHRILPPPGRQHSRLQAQAATVSALPTPVSTPSCDATHLHPTSHPSQHHAPHHAPHHVPHHAPHHVPHHAPHQQAAPSPSAATVPLPNFCRGALIRLASGEIRRIEELTEEDFITCAERQQTLKTDLATVVRIQPLPGSQRVCISLRHGNHESEMETASEHPFFVKGLGWASSSPERSLQLLGLNCRRLQPGEVCMFVSHRQGEFQVPAPAPAPAPRSQARKQNKKLAPVSLPPPAPLSDSSSSPANTSGCKKRRWSAPDQLSSDDAGQNGHPRHAVSGLKLERVSE